LAAVPVKWAASAAFEAGDNYTMTAMPPEAACAAAKAKRPARVPAAI